MTGPPTSRGSCLGCAPLQRRTPTFPLRSCAWVLPSLFPGSSLPVPSRRRRSLWTPCGQRRPRRRRARAPTPRLQLPLPASLLKARFVYIRRGDTVPSLQPLYAGLYRVLSGGDKCFTVEIGGKAEVVSIDRLKPHLGQVLIAPAPPPTRGGPPRPPTRGGPPRPPSSSSAVPTGGRHWGVHRRSRAAAAGVCGLLAGSAAPAVNAPALLRPGCSYPFRPAS
jgi:hypothetical protein